MKQEEVTKVISRTLMKMDRTDLTATLTAFGVPRNLVLGAIHRQNYGPVRKYLRPLKLAAVYERTLRESGPI